MYVMSPTLTLQDIYISLSANLLAENDGDVWSRGARLETEGPSGTYNNCQ